MQLICCQVPDKAETERVAGNFGKESQHTAT
jgi:hypothetical protein